MVTKTHKTESALHVGLVRDLMAWLRDSNGYRIDAADLEGYPEPKAVQNDGTVGDGQSKRADIDAFDESEQVYVRGEAKTGDGDLDTEHSKTQFQLFANRHNTENGKASLLYIIVPSSKIAALEAVLKELGLLDKANVKPVKSGAYS